MEARSFADLAQRQARLLGALERLASGLTRLVDLSLEIGLGFADFLRCFLAFCFSHRSAA